MDAGNEIRHAEIYTIGHSNHPLEIFLELLIGAGVTAVADVRSVPYSKRHPQYRKQHLKSSLEAAGIAYVFLGEALGARPKDRELYVGGRADYDKIADSEAFHHGLERVEEGADRFRVALMCAEKEPLDCHRTLLVSRHLLKRGATIRHILADGSIEDGKATENRLVSSMGLAEGDLFASVEGECGIVEEAYRRRIAGYHSVR